MTNKKVIKQIFDNFIEVNWKMKFFMISFFWFIVAITWIIEPFFYIKIIDFIEKFISWKEKVVFSDIYYLMIIWWAYIIFALIINFIYRYLLVDKSVLKFHEAFYRKWTDRIISMDYESYLNKKQWSLFKKFDRWLMDQFNFLFFFFLDLIKNLSWIILMVFVLFYIDYRMAIATLAMLPFMIFIWFYFNWKTSELQKEVNKDWDKSYWIFWDALLNLSLIKTLTLEKKFWKMMEKLDKKTIWKQLKVSKRWSVADIYTWFLVMISRLLVLSYGFHLLIIWEISFSLLFLFFSFIWYIYFPISFIFSKLRQVQEYISSVNNFYDEFWDLKIDSNIWDSLKSKNVVWNIEFKKVSFWYNKRKVLNNIDLKIEKWTKIALVWNTWAWKSTIVNLLFRFWDIEKWEILLDWKNINNISKDSIRKNIGIVMQDNSLFNASIKENLLYANPKASNEEINNAIKYAEAQFVFKLKKWIETKIWERGLKLSGWEKQRLTIARLLLKNPKILILDEATSALDNKTEKLVQKALDKLMKWRTSIVIAHRLSTIQNSDKIFMLENWKIIESWKYNELMANKWKFYELANPEHLIIN